MKIIKKGNLPVYKGVCQTCGCEFEVNHLETEKEVHEYQFTQNVTKCYVKCPCCEDIVYVQKINE